MDEEEKTEFLRRLKRFLDEQLGRGKNGQDSERDPKRDPAFDRGV